MKIKCDYCKYEIKEGEEYWDFDDVIACEMCLHEYFEELKYEHRKVNELVDYQYDSWKDDKALEEIMKER